ncbi:hypothetical protein P154DRAFT_522701 [Amniculicola lignicola CBS 123094]|uniref:Uncharacterized protein n=1 Tax=Amniculicola lignicola CBS 123094 TaxID=1392246 RepID=A0A6A5WEA6_9PLEO|nr:hypothetical protein P154DRAFT_522701 [Amniculicola lignicola CBS 123094]
MPSNPLCTGEIANFAQRGTGSRTRFYTGIAKMSAPQLEWTTEAQPQQLIALVEEAREEIIRLASNVRFLPGKSTATFTVEQPQIEQKIKEIWPDKQYRHSSGTALGRGITEFGPTYSYIILPLGIIGSPKVAVNGRAISWDDKTIGLVSSGVAEVQVGGSGRLVALIFVFSR